MTLDRHTLQARHLITLAIHDFFRERGYISIDTPILVRTPGTEVHLDYFSTSWVDYHNVGHPLFMRSSPELALKRALCAGFPKIYQIAKCFRNHGELTDWHHPEFTMLEWYQTGISYEDFMVMTEQLLRFTYSAVQKTFPPAFTLPKMIPRLSVAAAFEDFARIKLIDNDEDLAAKAIARGFHSVHKDDDFETAFFKILLDVIEPELKKLSAVFFYDYPPSQAALARVESGAAKRFELYVNGVELCNAFWELLDLAENQQRFATTTQRRKELGKTPVEEDSAFYTALAGGMPDCCGNALGVDRWIALLLGKSSLNQVIPFRRDDPFGDQL